MSKANYKFDIETTLQVTLWSEENIGLMRHIIYFAHDHVTMTLEHRGSIKKLNLPPDEANKILMIIRGLNPTLGNPLANKKYWMTIESPCLKLEYKWNETSDEEWHQCNKLKDSIHKLMA
jgi:hypothetical protein